MQFSFLLTVLLLALAQVEAAPVKPQQRTVTLPLKRLPQRSDLPPTVLLQQHINRSHRRHARMTGREGPSDAELVKRMEKRLHQARYDKRFNRNGVNVPASNNEDVGIKGPNRLDSNQLGNGNQNNSSNGFPQAGLDAQNAGNLTIANQPTTNNSLGLDVEGNDVGYVATVQVGTPPRDFSILMDSGSADFWIGGEGCQSLGGGDCGNHVFLGPNSSSSFQTSGQQFQVTYGSGQVAGDIVADNVSIAGLDLAQHVFGVALLESQDFSNDTTKFDGLMGLAQSPLSNQGVLTPVESLAKNGLISEAITSYKISRVSDGLNDGEITFGGLDASKFDSTTLVTVDNVNPQGFWEASFTVSAGGKDLGLTGRTAILDTGTTLIIAPANDAQAVHAMIPGSQSDGQGGFIIPCTTTTVVSLAFGGKNFDINPVDLLFTPVDPNNLQGDCISGISTGTIGTPQQWLVGDVFLKNAYYSTNVQKNTISLAKLV
ncbi:acid protease [Thelephora terrestris]|uniref:Acid protease n=1 Tax=Thelephora terrestris TaxID=56493 RepID=A0A9P6HLX0_9AGAM|nr:acid protease [Thelephora terrestris]